jgi:anti-sigma regulatory factor (Ser/Thr protein kinase)
MVEQVEGTATWEADPATPSRARALVERVLRRCGLAELVPTAALLTSEVVTNAVMHVGGAIAVRVTCRPRGLRVEVGDHGPPLFVPGAPTPASTSGRGLQLVDALASEWGTSRDATGKVVWFELAVDQGRRASNG